MTKPNPNDFLPAPEECAEGHGFEPGDPPMELVEDEDEPGMFLWRCECGCEHPATLKSEVKQ